MGELEGDVGVFGSVFSEGFEGDGLHVDLLLFGSGLLLCFLLGGKREEVVFGGFFRFPWPGGFFLRLCGEVGQLDGLIAEEVLGEAVHGVTLVGVEQGVDNHGVEEGTGDGEFVTIENVEVELEIVSDLFGGLGKEFLQACVVDSIVGEVVGGAGFESEGDAEDFGLEAVEGGGFEIEAVAFGRFEGGEEVFFEGGGIDENVVGLGVGEGFEGGSFFGGGCFIWGGASASRSFAEEAGGEGAEFVFGEDFLDLLFVVGTEERSSKETSRGASRMMVARSLERRAFSLLFSTFSFCLPFSLSVFLRSSSMEPNWAMSLTAVLGPMPGTPGMLSEASPMSPRRSMIW